MDNKTKKEIEDIKKQIKEIKEKINDLYKMHNALCISLRHKFESLNNYLSEKFNERI